ncbi:hypothetical protein DFR58_1109 [Anaerobacterium chartisolvens]|uniref:Uncharacterized protein n=1 Tax=Anaerobacterium chartisolvens TaxID=1297424 RepID=A0A369B7J1_9FIRM|nr:hypothetical protein [Anaerobacterium chartisolvens]RCX16516.1 hypothetical protein DFR58_1109 [Anaerobacterium chartisolvens]
MKHTVVNADDHEFAAKINAIKQAIQNAGPNDFVVFIKQTHPTETINIIADNDPTHMSKDTAKWPEKHP